MSRATFADNSTSVSLFPFLAVLLCTMGALLVVLVAMTRSARDVAMRKAENQPAAADAQTDSATLEELETVQAYLKRLERMRAQAASALHEDQQRLSHLEDHMRRLQDQLQGLQVAAGELVALEDEHYDDREQAAREVERLKRLITETHDAIAALKEEQKTNKRSYALVPYEGPNGTLRRPIYVECLQGELILQPEGIRISRDDLRPPLGAGNALASALRAARSYWVQHRPQEGRNRDAEPYPLVVVRPSGVDVYSLAQRAIKASDFDFGYELVEEDWELKYPAPDPQLASIEQQAIDQARMRQLALAAAAPRAYRQADLAAGSRLDFEADGEDRFENSTAHGENAAGDGLPGAAVLAGEGTGIGRAGGTGQPPLGSDGDPSSLTAGAGSGSLENATGQPLTGSTGGAVDGGAPGSGRAPSNGSATAAASTGAPAGGNSSSGVGSQGATARTSRIAHLDPVPTQQNIELAMTRGKDWALRGKGARAVPIRRTIQIVVRNDHLAILSDETQSTARAPIRKTIPLERDTVTSVDEFVNAVQYQIESWGTAGDGMYWRPVLQLQVAPDGAYRAQDLTRLLQDSGFELQTPATASQNLRGNPGATR